MGRYCSRTRGQRFSPSIFCDGCERCNAVSARSLAKALGDEQLIEVSADKKNTQTKRFGNRSVRVLTLKKAEANRIADLYC